MDKIESIVLQNLIYNDEYVRKVIPYLKSDYFSNKSERQLYEIVDKFVKEYNSLPSMDAIRIISGKEIKNNEILNEINIELTKFEKNKLNNVNDQWLLDETEKFCQERSLYLAALKTIEILDDKKTPKGGIPQIFQDALAVSFDPHVGHDYFEDAEKRFEHFHKDEHKIPFDIEWLNKITNDGVPTKTLNLILAGTNTGKTLCLSHLAAYYLSMGLNVFYATMEVCEEEIARRIDANRFDIDLNIINNLSKEYYLKEIDKIKIKTQGKLIIKEYPTGAASVINFKSTLNELFLKKGFKPKIIIIDYIGICSSARLKPSSGMYELGKAVSEELRGLAFEMDAVLWSAGQFNRKGYGSSSPGLGEMSESIAIGFTSDFTIAIVSDEDLEQLNHYLCIQLKNRYGDVTQYKRHIIGVDRSKQKIYDVGDVQDSEEDEIKENDNTADKFRNFKI